MKLTDMSFNMDQVNFTNEGLKDTMLTVNAMKTASKEMKQQYKAINLDKIEVIADCFIYMRAHRIIFIGSTR